MGETATAAPSTSGQLFSYDLKCANGHRWTRMMTRDEFVESDCRCPKCKEPGKRDIAIAGGSISVARELKYPYVNMQLPFKYRRDAKGNVIETIKPVIENAQQERNYAAGGWNGEQYRINQL